MYQYISLIQSYSLCILTVLWAQTPYLSLDLRIQPSQGNDVNSSARGLRQVIFLQSQKVSAYAEIMKLILTHRLLQAKTLLAWVISSWKLNRLLQCNDFIIAIHQWAKWNVSNQSVQCDETNLSLWFATRNSTSEMLNDNNNLSDLRFTLTQLLVHFEGLFVVLYSCCRVDTTSDSL